MTRFLVLLLVAVLALGACGDDGDDVGTTDDPGGGGTATEPGPPSAGDDPLDGRTFVGTEPEQADPPLVEGTELRVAFADGTISVGAGCNQMSGGYALAGDTLTVDALAGTEMGCEPAMMDQDATLAAFFSAPVTWTLDGDHLSLAGADGSGYELDDVAVASPDAQLVGPTWTLDTLVEGTGPDGTASSVPPGVTATITFADDGTYQVATGCNTGNGTWTTPEGGGPTSYELTAPALTRMACRDEGAAEVEAAMVAVLDGLVTMEITEQRLDITQGATDTGLGLTAG